MQGIKKILDKEMVENCSGAVSKMAISLVLFRGLVITKDHCFIKILWH